MQLESAFFYGINTNVLPRATALVTRCGTISSAIGISPLPEDFKFSGDCQILFRPRIRSGERSRVTTYKMV
jgi:hypothetical protein